MTKEEMDKLTEGADVFRNVDVRQVQSGFILVGRARWMDRTSGGQVMTLEAEGIAADAAAAGAAATRWLTTGGF